MSKRAQGKILRRLKDLSAKDAVASAKTSLELTGIHSISYKTRLEVAELKMYVLLIKQAVAPDDADHRSLRMVLSDLYAKVGECYDYLRFGYENNLGALKKLQEAYATLSDLELLRHQNVEEKLVKELELLSHHLGVLHREQKEGFSNLDNQYGALARALNDLDGRIDQLYKPLAWISGASQEQLEQGPPES